MNKKINIITLGDIFENLETDEKAFEFLKYIKELQEENKKQKEVLDKIKEYIAMVEHFALVDKKIIFSIKTLKDILEEIK